MTAANTLPQVELWLAYPQHLYNGELSEAASLDVEIRAVIEAFGFRWTDYGVGFGNRDIGFERDTALSEPEKFALRAVLKGMPYVTRATLMEGLLR